MNLSAKIFPCPMVVDVKCRKIVDAAEIFNDDDGIYECTLTKVRTARIVFNFKDHFDI